MRTIKFSRLIALTILVAGSFAAVSAQEAARLRFDRLNSLETKARDVVEVNVDGKLLELAKRVTVKLKDDDARKVGTAISGLKGIYVRVYNFEKENEYNVSDVDEVRAQLLTPGWEKLANVRIIDFAPTLARLLDLPRPKDATGRVLLEPQPERR